MILKKSNATYTTIILDLIIIIFIFINILSSIVLAQQPPDGMEFNVDPLLILTIIAREIVLIGLGSFLLFKWFKAEKRFITDLPFLMALTTFILVVAKAYDLYLYNFFGDYDFSLYFTEDPNIIWYGKIRWLIMMVNTVPLVGLLLSIWMADYKKKYFYLILITFISFWTIYIVLVPSFEYLKNVNAFLLLPVLILSIITFLFLYRNKRLPHVHSLIIAIAWIAYLISSILRPFFLTIGEPPWGIAWISEILDLIIWSIATLGFVIKPKYYHNK